MKYRKLRIAWSVGWGLLAVSLVLLWVRSYWWMDMLNAPLPGANEFTVITVQGRTILLVERSRFADSELELNSSVVNAFNAKLIARDIPDDYLGFRKSQDQHVIAAPYWLLVMFFGVAASLPWLRLRFSLRTLLIATTLIAVVLGIIVWMSK